VGRATAREFARHGATVGLIARNERALAACAEEIRSLGGRALALRADVADADAVQGAADALEREHGPIEVWVNNAMATVFGPVGEITAEEYRRVRAKSPISASSTGRSARCVRCARASAA
jgi:NAD(P)-dependent dehydrogenase (short-subunit alcohol dehydrogenase family)